MRGARRDVMGGTKGCQDFQQFYNTLLDLSINLDACRTPKSAKTNPNHLISPLLTPDARKGDSLSSDPPRMESYFVVLWYISIKPPIPALVIPLPPQI